MVSSQRRVILITGASRGIGRAAALAFADRDHFIIGTARSNASFGDLANEVASRNGDSWLVACDMADGTALNRLCNEISARFKRLDGLFGNAGILGAKRPVGELLPEEFDEAIAVNLTANFRLLHNCDLLLRASKAGRALFVTSGVAWKRHAGWTPYAVTKAGLEAMVGVYANEVANTTVRANLISPGPIRTELRSEAWPGEDPANVPLPDALVPDIRHLLSAQLTENGLIYDFSNRRYIRPLVPG